MADDLRYRLQRRNPYAPDRASRASTAPKDDPLAELARLIGQDEAFLAAARQSARARPDAGPGSDKDSASNWLDRTTERSRAPLSSGYASEARLRERDDLGAQQEAEIGHVEADSDWSVTSSDEHETQWHEPHYDAARRPEKKPWFLAQTREQEPAFHGADDQYDPAHGGEYDEEGDPQLPAVDLFDSERDPFRDAVDHEEQRTAFRGRGGILTIAAVAALALLGTAAAFGYRAWNSSAATGDPPLIKADTAPTKVIPAQNGDAQSNKLIYDRIGEKIQQTSTDKIVSREEQPMDLGRQIPARTAAPSAPGTVGTVSIGQPPAYVAPTRPASAGADVDQPKKVHTIPIRPDQAAMPTSADAAPSPVRPLPSLAPNQGSRLGATGSTGARANPPKAGAPEPLALNSAEEPAPPAARSSPAPSRPTQTASLPPPAETGNYVVQLSSQRSESEAQASFRALQAKYPSVLGSRHPLIRRADLGSKGVYYRAQVGPFASVDDANQVCSELKTAGGQCIVQRN